MNRAGCEAIARKLGNALCGPNVAFVPEGNFDPPTGALMYPGSIGVSDATFQALLSDIANSFRVTGFQNVILIGDSGGNQRGMKEVASDALGANGPAARRASTTLPTTTTASTRSSSSRRRPSAGSRCPTAATTTR